MTFKGHDIGVLYCDYETLNLQIEAGVVASQRPVVYPVNIKLKDDSRSITGIKDWYCGCKNGNAPCSHKAAALLVAQRDYSLRSVT